MLGEYSGGKIWNHSFLTKAVAQRCFVKNMFLKISQNSQENTYAVYFLKNCRERDSGTDVFLWILRNFKSSYFTEYFLRTTFVLQTLVFIKVLEILQFFAIDWCTMTSLYRSSRPEVFLGKGALKICSKFTGEHSCRNAISIKLLCNFIEFGGGLKRGTHLEFNAIKMLKKISLALLTQVET